MRDRPLRNQMPVGPDWTSVLQKLLLLPMLTLQELARIAEGDADCLTAEVRSFRIGSRTFDFSKGPALMGVINLSPGSWYRESVCLSTDAAIERGRVLHAQGADLVDLGAESTLAHTERAAADRQVEQLAPIVRELAEEGVLVSVETYYAAVAAAMLKTGAKVINLTGTQESAAIYRLAREADAAVIICFLDAIDGSNVREVKDFQLEGDALERMKGFFGRQLELASKAGLEKIFLDPGLGFYYRNLQDSAVRVRHQMLTFLQTFRLRTFGFPICHALPHAVEYFGEEVRSAEPFFAVLAALGKTDLFRTHEVAKVRPVLRTMQLL